MSKLAVNIDEVQRLIEPLAKSKLIEAVQAGNIDEVKRLIEPLVKSDVIEEIDFLDLEENAAPFNRTLDDDSGRGIINFQDNYGFSALMYACIAGNYEIAIYLLEHGADVNLRTHTVDRGGKITSYNDGRDALIFASATNNDQLVKLLLDYEANPNVKPKDLHSALVSLVLVGNKTMVELLLNKCVNEAIKVAAFFSAVRIKRYDMIDLLLAKGVAINSVFEDSTALMRATKVGEFETIKFLIERKALINLQNSKGQSAFLLAVQIGSQEIVNYFIDRGCDVESKNKNGISALMIAAGAGNVEMMKFLLEKVASVNHNCYINAQDNSGYSALMVAAESKKMDAIEYLLEQKNIYFTHKDINNSGLVMLAVQNNKADILKILIDKGCDINLLDDHRNSPLMFAVFNNNFVIAEMLSGAGALLVNLPILLVRNKDKLSEKMVKFVESLLYFDEMLASENTAVELTDEEDKGGLNSNHTLDKALFQTYIETFAARAIHRLTKTTLYTNIDALELELAKHSTEISPEITNRVKEAMLINKIACNIDEAKSYDGELPELSAEMKEKIIALFTMKFYQFSMLEKNYEKMFSVLKASSWPEDLKREIGERIDNALDDSSDDEEDKILDWCPHPESFKSVKYERVLENGVVDFVLVEEEVELVGGDWL